MTTPNIILTIRIIFLAGMIAAMVTLGVKFPGLFTSFLTITFFSVFPLAIYAYTKTGAQDFSWVCFVSTSRNRLFILCGINTFAAIAVSVWPDSRAALSATMSLLGGLVGLVVPITAINDFLIGLLNGGMAVVALRGSDK